MGRPSTLDHQLVNFKLTQDWRQMICVLVKTNSSLIDWWPSRIASWMHVWSSKLALTCIHVWPRLKNRGASGSCTWSGPSPFNRPITLGDVTSVSYSGNRNRKSKWVIWSVGILDCGQKTCAMRKGTWRPNRCQEWNCLVWRTKVELCEGYNVSICTKTKKWLNRVDKLHETLVLQRSRGFMALKGEEKSLRRTGQTGWQSF